MIYFRLKYKRILRRHSSFIRNVLFLASSICVIFPLIILYLRSRLISRLINQVKSSPNQVCTLSTQKNKDPKAEIDSQTFEFYHTEKLILFWGEFYTKKSLKMKCITSAGDMDFCPYKCNFTNIHDFLNISDAVVIHGRELREVPFPQWRRENQRWIFLMFESKSNSRHTAILSKNPTNKWNAPGVFNWTMSYRSDSDVYVPYGKVVNIPGITSFLPNLNEIKNKSLVAWAVSHCNYSVDSNRNRLVEALQRRLKVDIFGHCGSNPCPGGHPNDDPCESPEQCYKLMGSKYKFYLAFENSLCPEYITEKFFFPLKHGMVPVVLGPSREHFEKLAPPNSFIHVDDFATVSDLANYLIYLDTDTASYLSYFDWKKDYAIDDQFYFRRSWCSLCQKLHEENKNRSQSKSYENIYDWWHKNETISFQPSCSKLIFKGNASDEGPYTISV